MNVNVVLVKRRREQGRDVMQRGGFIVICQLLPLPIRNTPGMRLAAAILSQ